MIKRIAIVSIGALLTGCAGITGQLKFSKPQSEDRPEITGAVSGTIKVRMNKIQEFRALLEALEYRVTERPRQ